MHYANSRIGILTRYPHLATPEELTHLADILLSAAPSVSGKSNRAAFHKSCRPWKSPIRQERFEAAAITAEEWTTQELGSLQGRRQSLSCSVEEAIEAYALEG